MIHFFRTSEQHIYAVQSIEPLHDSDIQKLKWLFGEAQPLTEQCPTERFVGPRREMITPWSTNAVEITQNMGISGILRIEEFAPLATEAARDEVDPMLQRIYEGLDQAVFTTDRQPEPILYIDDIAACNRQEGLALSAAEIDYLNGLSRKLGRKLTDSEVFGFSQVNSEHCRHKIFGGKFIIDGEEKESSLFDMIKKTSAVHPNQLVSAYKDNVAFNTGPDVEQFAPLSGDKPDYYAVKRIATVLSLKAETHNFPTTVEPFNGAATGTGGEIRDRLGGGKASLPIAGTAVYMTSYPRTEAGRTWEKYLGPRQWLYQTPEQILIKASNGASAFGNHFGQPLICGSLLTFEHEENEKTCGYDKVIMLAGGVGYGKKEDALKGEPEAGDKIVVMGGDNYRIGMGGGAVSSVETGQYGNAIELNAVQRANPEMQKRVANVIRTLSESDDNPIVSIHDHGAGGHLNSLSELVESIGGRIGLSKLPVGDPTLSAKEIIGNESQERMGLLIKEKDVEYVQRLAERERAPIYVVGETTGDMQFVFEQADGTKPIDMQLSDFFGNPPQTVMEDTTVEEKYAPVETEEEKIMEYIRHVLQVESVACKDWLTNKVDRSVTGRIAQQQCVGELQLPLADLGAVALDYRGEKGMATAIGHAPLAALADPAAGSVLAIAEALTNIVWAPLAEGLKSVSLSANWMWPCKNQGEDARLYKAVEACSRFACELGINIPTGKDSLSMTQKYGEKKVFSPGTVIISAGAEISNLKRIVEPVLVNDPDTAVYYIDFSFDKQQLGGSVLAQTLNKIGGDVPTVKDAGYFKSAFDSIQELINNGLILAGHDISEGGMLTALLEMCFANREGGLYVNLDPVAESSIIHTLFAENPGVLIQVRAKKAVEKVLSAHGVGYALIARPIAERRLEVHKKKTAYVFAVNELRDVWYRSSYLLDRRQSGEQCAEERYVNYKNQALEFKYPVSFKGKLSQFGLSYHREPSGVKAAIIREKGTNGEREMAYTLYLAGFDVKDVHTTDLVSGRETLEDVNMIVFCGGFSNSDVLGSAKGWAGGFLYNEKAKKALERFYGRTDTLSLGICNGCQLMVELGLITPEHEVKPKMLHNDSHKFESNFISLAIPENNSVMFGSLSGSKIGVWVAHGEGRFRLPQPESAYNIVAKYTHEGYPANPNGSDYCVAGIASSDGRHLGMMPHPERAIFPWQCAHYPADRLRSDQITPWMEAFVNARKWIENSD
ncbi:MAG: phosphoribosylformylglycinamidine synthase [Prevotellaceae bacterium]|jgi:phosphoribosylformylglycinamidine synthase|nr:phosphoribosylformylglycinamidine synthase [Prevotellaceae bacterium]